MGPWGPWDQRDPWDQWDPWKSVHGTHIILDRMVHPSTTGWRNILQSRLVPCSRKFDVRLPGIEIMVCFTAEKLAAGGSVSAKRGAKLKQGGTQVPEDTGVAKELVV